jgi:ssDNA-binding Zn-finger/Zn-ribbon topoisomerase 1
MVHQPLVANCPECGKPLRKKKGDARYSCENSACRVIEVRHPDTPFMEIQYEARFRS